MANGKRSVGGRITGFYCNEGVEVNRDVESTEQIADLHGGEENGIYEVERVVEIKRKRVSYFFKSYI